MSIYEEKDDDLYDKDLGQETGFSKEEITGRNKTSLGKFLGVLLLGLVGVFLVYIWMPKKASQEVVPQTGNNRLVTTSETFDPRGFLPEPEPEVVENLEEEKELPPLPDLAFEPQEDPVLKRRMKSGMVIKINRSSSVSSSTPTPSSYSDAGSSGAAFPEQRLGENFSDISGISGTGEKKSVLEEKYTPTVTRKTLASRIKNPSVTVGKGTIIPCSLETEIQSDQVGMTTCIVNRDVYSMDGQVVLMERGTRLIGEYQSGIVRGQPSLFVLWTEATTPNHVVVNLNSPSAGRLGAAGVQGYVNEHFWKRFGASIMYSMLNIGIQTGLRKADSDIDLSGTTNDSSEIIATILNKTIDIPPTLFKPHGEQINVITSRNLDFSTVYRLER